MHREVAALEAHLCNMFDQGARINHVGRAVRELVWVTLHTRKGTCVHGNLLTRCMQCGRGVGMVWYGMAWHGMMRIWKGACVHGRHVFGRYLVHHHPVVDAPPLAPARVKPPVRRERKGERGHAEINTETTNNRATLDSPK